MPASGIVKGVDNDTNNVNADDYHAAVQGLSPGQLSIFSSSMGTYLSQGESPSALVGWFTDQMNQINQAPELAALYSVYGNPFVKIWMKDRKTGASFDTTKGNMIAAGMSPSDERVSSAYAKIVKGRGPGGGGSGPTKAQQYAAAEAAIRNEVNTLGHTTFGEARIKQTAQQAVNGNWSADQLTDFLVGDATKNWDKLTGGTLKGSVDQIKAAAAKQLIKISDATARQWAGRLASGEVDSSGVANMMQDQAVARHAWAADVIKKGITMQDYLAPSRDRIAEVLEVPPEKVDLMDARWSKMVTVTDDKGVTRAANDDEIIRAARSDGAWVNTKNARQLATSATMALRNYIEGRN